MRVLRNSRTLRTTPKKLNSSIASIKSDSNKTMHLLNTQHTPIKKSKIKTNKKSEIKIMLEIEQTNNQIDSTVCAFPSVAVQVENTNQNKSNVCQREKNQKKVLYFHEESLKQVVEIKENNTNNSCFSTIEEHNIEDKGLKTNKYFEHSMKMKDIHNEINSTDAGNLYKIKSEALETNESREQVQENESITTKTKHYQNEDNANIRCMPPTNEEIMALISSYTLVTIQKETNPKSLNTQNNPTKSIHKLKELKESEYHQVSVEEGIIQNDTPTPKDEIITNIDKFEQTINHIDLIDVLEIKENLQNNSNNPGEKNQNGDTNFQEQQKECLKNVLFKEEVEIEQNKTSGSCFSNIDEKSYKHQMFEKCKPEELKTNNTFVDYSLQVKENKPNSYMFFVKILSDVDNLNKLEESTITKQEIDVEGKEVYMCTSNQEDSMEVDISKQEDSKFVEHVFTISSNSQNINNDINYISINFNNTTSKILGKFSHNKILNEIRSIYMFYFNETIEPMLDILSSSLSSAAQVLRCWFIKKEETQSSQVDFCLKDYSAHFVNTFKSIECQFSEGHRSLMITVLYLHLLKKAKNQAFITPQLMKTVAARLFTIENYCNIYDTISNSSHTNAKSKLQFFNKLLEKVLVEPIEKSDRKRCSDWFLNCNKKIDQTGLEEKYQGISSTTINVQPADFHARLNEVQNDFEFTINSDIEMILDYHNSRTNENRGKKNFHIELLVSLH